MQFLAPIDLTPMINLTPMDLTPESNMTPMDNLAPMDDMTPIDNLAPMRYHVKSRAADARGGRRADRWKQSRS